MYFPQSSSGPSLLTGYSPKVPRKELLHHGPVTKSRPHTHNQTRPSTSKAKEEGVGESWYMCVKFMNFRKKFI